MNKKQTYLHTLFLAFLLLTLTGCHETFVTFFSDLGKDAGWTKEQILAARYEAYRILFLKEKKDKSGYDILYSRLTNQEVLDKVEEMRKTLEQDLDYKDESSARYIDYHNLRPFLQHQERIFESLVRRLRARELENTFAELLGLRGNEGGDENQPMDGPSSADIRTRYDASLIFAKDPKSLFSVKITSLEEARKNGRLKLIETILINTDAKLSYKEPDPNDPTDPNKFLWQQRKLGLEIRAYKIYDNTRPPDNNPHYIVGHRVWMSSADTESGKIDIYREALPAIQVFYNPEQNNGVAVIDSDSENESGYGVPDLVERTGSISKLNIFSYKVWDKIFPVKEKNRRIKPVRDAIRVEIAPVSESIDVWEQAAESFGWKVPVIYVGEKKDNYHVKIKFKMPEMIKPDMPKVIEAIKKEWHAADKNRAVSGSVIEYYRPKSPYDGELADAKVLYKENTKRILFVTLDGSEARGMVIPGPNAFVEDRPFAIEYSEGDIRWRLESTKYDGIYDRRKKIAPLQSTVVGQYQNGDEVEAQSQYNGDGHGH